MTRCLLLVCAAWSLAGDTTMVAAASPRTAAERTPHLLRTGARNLPGGGEYRLYLPPLYPEGGPFPVLYFLHDFFGGSDTLWRRGVIHELDRRVRQGEIAPFVLVAPEGRRGYWSDFHARQRPWESWLVGALREEIESTVDVRTDREGRWIAGVSMGGYGAVKAALRQPGLYGGALSVSGVLFPNDWQLLQRTAWINRVALKRVFGWTREDNSFARNDVFRLAEKVDARVAPRLWLRCGVSDKYGLGEAAAVFAEHLRGEGVTVDLSLEPGGHDWHYWRTSVVDGVVELMGGRSS